MNRSTLAVSVLLGFTLCFPASVVAADVGERLVVAEDTHLQGDGGQPPIEVRRRSHLSIEH